MPPTPRTGGDPLAAAVNTPRSGQGYDPLTAAVNTPRGEQQPSDPVAFALQNRLSPVAQRVQAAPPAAKGGSSTWIVIAIIVALIAVYGAYFGIAP